MKRLTVCTPDGKNVVVGACGAKSSPARAEPGSVHHSKLASPLDPAERRTRISANFWPAPIGYDAEARLIFSVLSIGRAALGAALRFLMSAFEGAGAAGGSDSSVSASASARSTFKAVLAASASGSAASIATLGALGRLSTAQVMPQTRIVASRTINTDILWPLAMGKAWKSCTTRPEPKGS